MKLTYAVQVKNASQYGRKTYDEFEDERESIFRVNNIVKCDDVGVLQAFQ